MSSRPTSEPTEISQPDALDVRKLTSGYGGQAVVHDIDLRVSPGEVVALLGPNGAGKSTVLSTVAGLVGPMGGHVRMHGTDVTGRPAHRLARTHCALVPEGRSLFQDLTVREHLHLASTRSGVTEEALLELLPELRACRDRKAGVMSGGEQQMLAVGRALINRPRLLLVDELSLGLAPLIVQRLLPVLRQVADDFGTAVLFVEQHVSLALAIADRAYLINHGRIVLEGPAAALRDDRQVMISAYLGDQAMLGFPSQPLPGFHR